MESNETNMSYNKTEEELVSSPSDIIAMILFDLYLSLSRSLSSSLAIICLVQRRVIMMMITSVILTLWG